MIKLLSTIDDPFERLTTRFCRPNKLLKINGLNYIVFSQSNELLAVPRDYCHLIETFDGPILAVGRNGEIVSGERFSADCLFWVHWLREMVLIFRGDLLEGSGSLEFS